MKFTPQQVQQINDLIEPIFDQVLAEYSFEKYPAQNYASFQSAFSQGTATNTDIQQAMAWKWGHWGKPDYPQHHKNLITEIQALWPAYLNLQRPVPRQTFDWWKEKLARKTTYITEAYITHLVHHAAPLPIIDQHNFRAMNHLLAHVNRDHRAKKKPSNWTDIENLKCFMSTLVAALPNRSFSELDKFLMMFGRNHVPR